MCDCVSVQRAGRASIFGCFILGPLAHLHFNFLEWLIVRRVRTACSPGDHHPSVVLLLLLLLSLHLQDPPCPLPRCSLTSSHTGPSALTQSTCSGKYPSLLHLLLLLFVFLLLLLLLFIFLLLLLLSIPKLEGKTNQQCVENIKLRIWPTMKANWMLWPLAQVSMPRLSVTSPTHTHRVHLIWTPYQLVFVME